MVTVQPARVLRKRDFSICHTRSPMPTVLSLATIRSVCTLKIQSRSDRLVRRKALPFCSAATANWRVESVNVVLAQESVGLFPSADAGQPQFLGQASLPSAEIPFRPSSRLGRIRWNHLHTQLLQRSPDLR